MTTTIPRDPAANFQHPVHPMSDGRRDFLEEPISEENLSHWRAWQALIDDLLQARSLEDDYDGQGALAPEKDLVDSAIRLACQLRDIRFAPAQYATAGVNGTIHFEWIESTRSRDLEVIAPGRAELCEIDLLGESPPVVILEW